MAWTIDAETIDRREWGSVDKAGLRNQLQQALEAGEDGARRVVGEVYAVTRGQNLEESPSENWWGPHHVLTNDQRCVLSLGGIQAAYAALRGARAEPDLTAAQLREAARHVLRHYRVLLRKEEIAEIPDELKTMAGQGEMLSLLAGVTAEMGPAEIPAVVDVDALKAGDPDPLEVVVEIAPGRSKRGWTYQVSALEDIVAKVQGQTLDGYMGHQKPDNVEHEFPPIATHWIGAAMKNGKAYFRGVVDQAARDLKRWIRAGRVNSVSIFGVPRLSGNAVLGYEALSIDWTPLGRAGMETRLVYQGEIDWVVEDPPGQGAPGGQQRGGDQRMEDKNITTPDQALGMIAGEIARGALAPPYVLEKLGLDVRALAPEMAAKADKLDAVQKHLVVFGAEDPAEAAKLAGEMHNKREQDATQAVIGEVLAAKVGSDLARQLVGEMLQVTPGADKAAVEKAVDEVLGRDHVKRLISGLHGEQVPGGTPAPAGKDSRQFSQRRTVAF